MDTINLSKSIKMQLKCNKMHCLEDFIYIELLFLLFSYQTSNWMLNNLTRRKFAQIIISPRNSVGNCLFNATNISVGRNRAMYKMFIFSHWTGPHNLFLSQIYCTYSYLLVVHFNFCIIWQIYISYSFGVKYGIRKPQCTVVSRTPFLS